MQVNAEMNMLMYLQLRSVVDVSLIIVVIFQSVRFYHTHALQELQFFTRFRVFRSQTTTVILVVSNSKLHHLLLSHSSLQGAVQNDLNDRY